MLAHVDPARFPIGLPLDQSDPRERARLPAILSATTARVVAGEGYIESVAPVLSGARVVGLVLLRLSSDELDRSMAESGRVVLLLTAGMALAGSVFGLG